MKRMKIELDTLEEEYRIGKSVTKTIAKFKLLL